MLFHSTLGVFKEFAHTCTFCQFRADVEVILNCIPEVTYKLVCRGHSLGHRNASAAAAAALGTTDVVSSIPLATATLSLRPPRLGCLPRRQPGATASPPSSCYLVREGGRSRRHPVVSSATMAASTLPLPCQGQRSPAGIQRPRAQRPSPLNSAQDQSTGVRGFPPSPNPRVPHTPPCQRWSW